MINNLIKNQKFIQLIALVCVVSNFAYVEMREGQKESLVKEASIELEGKLFQRVKDKIDVQKAYTLKMYNENQLLFPKYAQYEELIKLLNLKNTYSVVGKVEKNKTLLNEEMNELNEYENILRKLEDFYKLNNSNDKYAFINTNKNFYNAYKKLVSNNFNNENNSLFALNKSIKADLNSLSETQNTLIEEVSNKVKEKSFNLKGLETMLVEGVKKETTKSNSDLNSLINDISKETELSKEETEDIKNSLNEVNSELNNLEKETVNKIKEDREKLESLIASLSKEEVKEQPKVETGVKANEPTPTQTTQVVNHYHNNDLGTYLLMYHWLSATNQSGIHNTQNNLSHLNSNYSKGSNLYSYNSSSSNGPSSAQKIKEKISSKISNVKTVLRKNREATNARNMSKLNSNKNTSNKNVSSSNSNNKTSSFSRGSSSRVSFGRRR